MVPLKVKSRSGAILSPMFVRVKIKDYKYLLGQGYNLRCLFPPFSLSNEEQLIFEYFYYEFTQSAHV